MSAQHTPGPWEVMNVTDVFTLNGGVCGDGRKADGNDGWQVADCSPGLTFVAGEQAELTMAECRANARLFAAAPDYHAGAATLLAWADELDADAKAEGFGGGSVTAKRIRAALSAAHAKATGEQL